MKKRLIAAFAAFAAMITLFSMMALAPSPADAGCRRYAPGTVTNRSDLGNGAWMTSYDLGSGSNLCNPPQKGYTLPPGHSSWSRGLDDADSYFDNKSYVGHDNVVYSAFALWKNGQSIGWTTILCENGWRGGRFYDVKCYVY